MLENSIYSVISPEGCASILAWPKQIFASSRSDETDKDLLKLKVIDEIIPEPLGGAHRDPENIAADIKHSIIKNLKILKIYQKMKYMITEKQNFFKLVEIKVLVNLLTYLIKD